jgi:hypothetical protein
VDLVAIECLTLDLLKSSVVGAVPPAQRNGKYNVWPGDIATWSQRPSGVRASELLSVILD